tara:strand:- start:708 stop:866 length:159 start_codon:yes stop_codon:yes gene_type:complete
MVTDSLLTPKKVRIETPVGNIESDSGNHLVDVGTIIVVIIIFFAAKKFFKAT